MKKMFFTILLAGLISPAASAENSSSTLTNTATVTSLCSLSNSKNLSFGNVNPITIANVWAQGLTEIGCSAGTYSVSINYGSNAQTFGSGSSLACQRRMKTSNNQYVAYNLMTDDTQSQFNYVSNTPSSGTTCAGSINLGSVTFNSNNRVAIYPVNAKMWTDKTTVIGSYQDSLTVSVTF